MSDLVPRLLAAIEETERNAEEARHMRWVFDTNRRNGRTVMQEYFTRNDPTAVLRRCAADRKIVGIHARLGDLKDPDDLTYPEAADTCFTCGPGDHYSAQENPGWYPFPCSTLRTLASGYGVSVDEETPG